MVLRACMRHAGNGLSCRSHNEVCLPSCHCCASGGHMHSSNSGVCRKQLQHHAETRQTVSHGCSSSELLQGGSAAMLRGFCLVAHLQKKIIMVALILCQVLYAGLGSCAHVLLLCANFSSLPCALYLYCKIEPAFSQRSVLSETKEYTKHNVCR